MESLLLHIMHMNKNRTKLNKQVIIMDPVFGICIMFHNVFSDSPSEYEWNRKLESDKLTVRNGSLDSCFFGRYYHQLCNQQCG